MSRNISFLDKENAVGRVGKEPKSFVTKPVAKMTKIARVPLGGKSNNRAIPTLDKSHSSLTSTNTGTSTSTNTNTNTDHRTNIITRRVPVPLSKPPLLSKANSSLGFSHSVRSFEPKTISTIRRSERVILKKLNSKLAPPAVRTTFTDELVKKNQNQNQNPSHTQTPNLISTITSHTDKLHSKNKVIHDINYNNVDPIKRSRRIIPTIPHHGYNYNYDYIETIPPKEDPLPSNPIGLEPLNNEDLQFFSKSTRSVVTSENIQDYPELQQNEDALNFEELDLDSNLSFDTMEQNISFDSESDLQDNSNGPLGLSAKELQDLLD
ncbi:uncharacterized protein RJT21DRAFT_1698 [Scheffersomyces amazonensis]|uniref:uncharacterized protein n=1 Tax=Scheffersomyces amazonensis TaxID=1078765 RepID=UPI00315DA9BF